METSVYKFDLGAFQGEPNASAVSLVSLAPENTRQVRRNWPQHGGKRASAKPAFRYFYNGLRGKITLGQMAWKQTCTNLR